MTKMLPAGKGPHPALILLHGAGGGFEHWLGSVGPSVLPLGMALFAPQYFDRTGTVRADIAAITDGLHFPEWLEAARDAVSAVAAHPAVDSARMGVLGISLGGYLAMALATGDARLHAVVEISGGIPQPWVSRVSSAMPPTLLLHGDADTVVPVTEAHNAARLLDKAGARHTLTILPGQGHWFSPAGQLQALAAVGRFLFGQLTPGSAAGTRL